MITGSFENGSPIIEVSIFGIVPTVSKKFKAIIDTGFNGFVQMGLMDAFGLALVLENISSSTIADGSQTYTLTAWGNLKVEDKEVEGFISLAQSSQTVLLGTQWLEKMKVELAVDCLNKTVKMIPIDLTQKSN